MKTIVSERGQITLPKAIRTRLGIKPGTILEITEVEGKIVGLKSEAVDPLRKWRGRGSLPPGITSVDSYLEVSRG